MKRSTGNGGKVRLTAALLVGAGLALTLPSTGAAVVGAPTTASESGADLEFMPFTPAGMDASLMSELASSVGLDALRFTPAARPGRKDRTLTVAVRVDQATARAISVRNTIDGATEAGRGSPLLALAPTRYDLGIARGYQGFTQPAPKPIAGLSGVRDIAMPDLAEFRPSQPQGKPSRFQPRIASERDDLPVSASRPLESLDEQSVDVGGSYRVTRNLDVTAGVRLSQERDRLAPLTDGIEDNQAVYVGTQFRF
ncbi:hypothetical protein A9995_13215 [Erythrobacter sp. QSSC1-22B]|uniref:hypothetical protein n=1 Tax=Erythrobacter sp. QSSC1-22B TaxID=1860125 RepID=UPI000806021C|nr:hypothetical protein [Erythrobacter sp. QSSC1-22B]OBX18116.1 hypothetical protein A9995_13215 [Erythrobacter sp. QSSC1-22B]